MSGRSINYIPGDMAILIGSGVIWSDACIKTERSLHGDHRFPGKSTVLVISVLTSGSVWGRKVFVLSPNFCGWTWTSHLTSAQ